jgi:UDPglucose 6-dehydrogenase
MRVSVLGAGYVGSSLAACLADFGHEVVAVDVDETKVDAINDARPPVHEPGLPERLAEHVGDRLRATIDYDAVPETDLTLVCVQTPSRDDGSIDLSVVEAAAAMLGDALAEKRGRHDVVVKSTVVPGTTEEVVAPTVAEHSGRTVGDDLGVAMNPEFQREGSAVADFLDPDKIVVGATDDAAVAALRDLYEPLLDDAHFVETGVREAEMIKYANNAFLAAKVSLVNDLANVCKEYGVDAYEVLDAVGLDHRISGRFMRSGLGWGGSCFPKDVAALRAAARDAGYDPALLDAAVAVNDEQPRRLVDLLARHVTLDGARVAVLGLAFKPGTDDVRNSRALDVLAALRDRGADPVGYDPVAVENAREAFPDAEYVDSAADALRGADAAVIATGWPEFDDLDWSAMARSVVVDGRHVDVDRDEVDVYEGLCW